MNTFNAAALLNTEMTTLKGYFARINADGTTGEKLSKSYTWFCPVNLSAILQPGDVVVASAQGELKLIVVEEIHPDSEIDLDAPFKYGFAVQKVRRHDHARMTEETERLGKELNKSRTQTLRAQVAAQFGARHLTFNRHTPDEE